MEHRWIWPFELEEQIGAGAMGVVYRARFVKNDRRVALKLLPAEIAADPILAARFQREMEVLKDLKHPNIVHSFGGLCEGKQWFYAMELIDGGTVEKLIQSSGRIRWQDAIPLALQTCAALEHAHTHGIVHRDVKPGNLLLTRSGKLKLGDFGLATMVAESRLTAAGKTVGSLHYMAPEQITGKSPVSPRTDLYAFGCTLFEMLAGKPPFAGTAVGEILQKHLKSPAPLISEIVLDCPDVLARVVAKLLAKKPDDRYQSAAEVAADLGELELGIVVKPSRGSLVVPKSSAKTVATPEASESEQTTSGGSPKNWQSRAGWGVAGLVAILFAIREWNRSSHQSIGPDVRTGLQSATPEVRQFAIRILTPDAVAEGRIPDDINRLLSDSSPLVRAEAAHAISRIAPDDASVQGTLTRMLNSDEDPKVRETAREALSNPPERPRTRALVYVVSLLAALLGGLAIWRGPRWIRYILAQVPADK
ncbi:MAG: protein kinase [Planctomycetota bacterium]|nr:protein kinase [Planctomycetota bacterium]